MPVTTTTIPASMKMAKKKRRHYTLEYFGDSPEYISGAGHLYKISGVLLQGKSKNIMLLLPTADVFPVDCIEVERLSVEEWSEFLRRTDDPVYFEKAEDGYAVKAVHRKCMAAISGAVQQRVWARDNFSCMYCSGKMGETQLTVDHWIPLELGGGNNVTNLVSACRRCNKVKGDLDPVDYCKQNDLDYDGIRLYLEDKASRLFKGHLS